MLCIINDWKSWLQIGQLLPQLTHTSVYLSHLDLHPFHLETVRPLSSHFLQLLLQPRQGIFVAFYQNLSCIDQLPLRLLIYADLSCVSGGNRNYLKLFLLTSLIFQATAHLIYLLMNAKYHMGLSCLLTTLLPLMFYMLPHYSNEALLYSQEGIWQPFLQFDSAHYFHHSYAHEPSHAFLPTYPLLIRVLVSNFPSVATALILLVNKLCFCLAALQIEPIFKEQYRGSCKEAAQIGFLLFVYNPASIFFHSLYTESPYTLLLFLCVRLSGRNRFLATLFLAGAGLFRSNTLLMSPIVGWPILTQLYSSLSAGKWRQACSSFLEGVASLILICLAFLYHQWQSYLRLCQQQKREFCQWVPNVYGYVQQEYWHVGFLSYFHPKNMLFIAIGLPALMVGAVIIWRGNYRNTGLWLSWVLLYAVVALMTNVQSSTRFFCSHPQFYIGLVELARHRAIRMWAALYYLLGMLLYSVGFPWT